MRRQTPNLGSRPALPTYPSGPARPPVVPRPPRGAAAALALTTLAAGCWPYHSHESVQFKSEYALTQLDQPVPLTTGQGTTCFPDWSVAEAASGRESQGASVTGDGPKATFTAHAPGEYVITARCGDASYKQRITAFAPSATLSPSAPKELPFGCQDAMPGPRGRILCVDHGVHIVDPETGAEVGKTAEAVPETWGLDVQGDRFVTVGIGCTPSREGCKGMTVEGGMYLYQLGSDDKPAPLGHLASSAQMVPLLDGTRLFVSDEQKIRRYSLQDPTKAAEVGCIENKELGLIPVPFFLGGKLGVLSWNNQLVVHDPDRATGACSSLTKSLARLELDPERKSAIFYTRPVENGALLYIGSSVALTTVDLTDPLQPSVVGRINISTDSAVIHGGRLIVLADASIVALDLLDPRHPRPVAQLRLVTGRFGESGTFDRVLVAGGKLWHARAKTLRRIDIR